MRHMLAEAIRIFENGGATEDPDYAAARRDRIEQRIEFLARYQIQPVSGIASSCSRLSDTR